MQLRGPGKPNRVLSKMRSSDLTYVWTAEGWLYRTVVIESVLTPRGWLADECRNGQSNSFLLNF